MNMAMADLFERLVAQLQQRLELLPDKPDETVDSTLRALWQTAAGHPVSASLAVQLPLPELDVPAQARLEALVDRRLGGAPLAHLSGRERFMQLELMTSADALVPRRETELLAVAAMELIADHPVTIIDACTGCGNLALALAHGAPHANVFASDISAATIALAQANARRLGLAERVEFHVGDLLAPFDTPRFRGQVDLLTCNPPYISSAKVSAMAAEIADHEPRLAFDGGPLGVAVVMRLLHDAPRLLRDGGWLVLEVGLGQGPGILRRLRTSDAWRDVRPVMDGADSIRVVLAQRNSTLTDEDAA